MTNCLVNNPIALMMQSRPGTPGYPPGGQHGHVIKSPQTRTHG